MSVIYTSVRVKASFHAAFHACRSMSHKPILVAQPAPACKGDRARFDLPPGTAFCAGTLRAIAPAVVSLPATKEFAACLMTKPRAGRCLAPASTSKTGRSRRGKTKRQGRSAVHCCVRRSAAPCCVPRRLRRRYRRSLVGACAQPRKPLEDRATTLPRVARTPISGTVSGAPTSVVLVFLRFVRN